MESGNEHALVTSPVFSINGFVHLIEAAIKFLKQAQRQELISIAYHLIIPFFERKHDNVKLAMVYGELQAAYQQIISFEAE